MLIQPTRKDIAYVLFHRGRLVVTTGLVCFSLAGLYCLVATPKYDASTSFVAEFSTLPSSMPGSTEQNLAAPTPMDHEEIINSYVLELQSAQLLRQVVEEIGADKLYPPKLSLNPLAYLPSFGPPADAQTIEEQKIQDAVERLTKKDLKVEGERDANVFNLSVKNPNRRLAVEVARRMSDAFMQLEGRIDRNPRLAFVQQQVDIDRKKVTEAQAAMDAFKKKNSISSMAEERTVLIQQRALLEQAMMAAEAKASESQTRYMSLSQQLAKISPVVSSAQNDRDPMELSARTNLAELEVREAQLRAEYSGDSKAVSDVERSIAAARQVLRRATQTAPLTHSDPNVAYQQLQVAALEAKGDWDAARQSASAQAAQLLELSNRLSATDGVESTYQNLVRDYQIADENYRAYLQGVQQARVAEDLNKAKVTSVAVFDAAYAPPKPTRPGILVLALGLFGGLFLGGLFAFLLEMMDETLSKPEQVEEVLDLPVLGSITMA